MYVASLSFHNLSVATMKATELTTVVVFLGVLLLPQPSNGDVEGSIRLRGGRSPLEGRVEIYLDREWGTIGVNGWGLEDANVTCRQLGFLTAISALGGGYFQPAPLGTPVHLDHMECDGDEGSVIGCKGQVMQRQRYGPHDQDSGVICAVEHSLRLVGNGNPNEGRLDILHNGEWSAFPVAIVGEEEAAVACRQLGYEGVIDVDGSTHSSHLDTVELNCTDEDFSLASCATFSIIGSGSGESLFLTPTAVLSCNGSPGPPHKPRMEEATCFTVTISWSKPPTRGSAITGYSLRYKPLESAIWEYMTIGDSHMQAAIGGLVPSGLYEMQVRASSTVGDSSFSESLVTMTTPAELQPPVSVTIGQVNSHSVSLTWTVSPSCGLTISGYELHYNTLSAPDIQFTEFVPETNNNDIIVNDIVTVEHTLNDLRPYLQYEVTVQVQGYSGHSNGSLVVSSFADPVTFTTAEAVPSGVPQSVTGFLTHIQSSAHFQWNPVPHDQRNGIITHYTLSCNHTTNGKQHNTIEQVFNNSTFQYELSDLEPGSHYQCTVSASTAKGIGPESSAIEFSTPTDLNTRPIPPRNVVFEVTNGSSGTVIVAQWAVSRCEGKFNCSDVLGYMVICRSESTATELRKTIWQSDVLNVSTVATADIEAEPYMRYSCSMAAFNTYGVGIPGSIMLVETPDSVPTLAPIQLYISDITGESVKLHWSYVEDPPVGMLVGFRIDTYYQDPRYPERYGEFVDEEYYYIISASGHSFSYTLMYLSAGVDYNMFISAVTHAGEGPGARVSMSTPQTRTEPTIAPSIVEIETITYVSPYRFHFTWELPPSKPPQRSLDHAGFIISCGPNSSASSLAVSHAVFTREEQEQYSETVPLPGSCSPDANVFMCFISAFNEVGKGAASDVQVVNIPCIAEVTDDLLSGTFLSHPYYSIAFLSALILLIISIPMVATLCCICNVCSSDCNKKKKRRPFNPYNSADLYNETYVSMAPSDARPKSFWTDRSRSTIRTAAIDEELEDPFNPYDEIPGDRQENVYDEIHPRMSRDISAITHENTGGGSMQLGDPIAETASADESVTECPIAENGSVMEFMHHHRQEGSYPTGTTSTPVTHIRAGSLTLIQTPPDSDYVEILSSICTVGGGNEQSTGSATRQYLSPPYCNIPALESTDRPDSGESSGIEMTSSPDISHSEGAAGYDHLAGDRDTSRSECDSGQDTSHCESVNDSSVTDSRRAAAGYDHLAGDRDTSRSECDSGQDTSHCESVNDSSVTDSRRAATGYDRLIVFSEAKHHLSDSTDAELPIVIEAENLSVE